MTSRGKRAPKKMNKCVVGLHHRGEGGEAYTMLLQQLSDFCGVGEERFVQGGAFAEGRREVELNGNERR